MVKIINLNKKRKAKKRVEKEKKAALNRVKFGRTKQEKQMAKATVEQERRKLDGHKIEEVKEEKMGTSSLSNSAPDDNKY